MPPRIPTLLTERLVLRGWTGTDRSTLAAIKSDARNWQFIATHPPRTDEEAAGQLDALLAEWREWGVGSWAVVEAATEDLVGDCGVKLTDRGPQLAYMISHAQCGRGFATEASRAVLTHVFDAYDWPVVYASTDTENAASQRVLEKVGMRKRRTFDRPGGREYWYELRRAASAPFEAR